MKSVLSFLPLMAAMALCGCVTPDSRSELIAGPDNVIRAPFRGVWHSAEKGWILEISSTQIVRWQYTPTGCYQSPRPDESTPLMGQVEYRFGRLIENGNAARFDYLPGDASAYFVRINALPEECGEEDLTAETAIFEVFASIMAEHYAFFDERGMDWAGITANARSRVEDGMGAAALWELLSDMLQPLGDSQKKLVGLVDGERTRAQAGLGQTLPMIRSSIGEGRWVNDLVDQLFDQVLDPGAELIADRVVVGEIEARIGYIQIFTMGGFTDTAEPGSVAWSDAELRALDDLLDNALTRFSGYEAVILDLSNNRGGYDAVTRSIASRFTNENFLGYRVTVPGHPEAATDYPIRPHDGLRYTGPVYLLTSDVTVSGGELTTLMLRQLRNVVHVGGTTRGAFSTPLAKPLPNGWYLELSSEVFESANGEIFEASGIPPEVEFDVYPETDPVEGHARAITQIVSMIDAG